MAEKRIGALSLLGQSLSSFSARSQFGASPPANDPWTDLTARVLHSSKWGEDTKASELLTKRDIELLGTNLKELKDWRQECARDVTPAQRHLITTALSALPEDHHLRMETYISAALLQYAKECLKDIDKGPPQGSTDWVDLEAGTNELAARLKDRLSPSKYLYSAFTVFPRSFDNLQAAISEGQAQLQTDGSGRDPIRQKIDGCPLGAIFQRAPGYLGLQRAYLSGAGEIRR